MTQKKLLQYSLSLLMVFIVHSMHAQDNPKTNDSNNNWQFILEPYIMLPNMSGETGIGNIPQVEVDASTSDIFGNLDMGAMLYVEATNNTWTVSSDLVYMKLGQDLKTGPIIIGGDVTMKELVWEIAGYRRVLPWLDAGIALRLVSLDMEINTYTLITDRNASADATWVDPVFAVKTQGLINDKWIYKIRGDIGGFGIGSDFTYQLHADFGYRFSKLFYTTIGYRIISMDYENGSGADRFLYDVDTYGTVIRFGFNL